MGRKEEFLLIVLDIFHHLRGPLTRLRWNSLWEMFQKKPSEENAESKSFYKFPCTNILYFKKFPLQVASTEECSVSIVITRYLKICNGSSGFIALPSRLPSCFILSNPEGSWFTVFTNMNIPKNCEEQYANWVASNKAVCHLVCCWSLWRELCVHNLPNSIRALNHLWAHPPKVRGLGRKAPAIFS